MPLDEALFHLCCLLRGEPSLPGSSQAGNKFMDFLAGETWDGVEVAEVLPQFVETLHRGLPTFLARRWACTDRHHRVKMRQGDPITEAVTLPWSRKLVQSNRTKSSWISMNGLAARDIDLSFVSATRIGMRHMRTFNPSISLTWISRPIPLLKPSAMDCAVLP